MVCADRQDDKRAVCLRDAHCLPLSAIEVSTAPKTSVQARGVQPLLAEDAGSVGPRERCRNDIADLDGTDICANGLDNADELVSMRRPVSLRSIFLYGQRSLPQMAARVTTTRASVGSMMRASGTLSIRTSPAPYITVARIVYLLFLTRSVQP